MRVLIVGVMFILSSCQDPEEKTIVGSWESAGSKYGTGAEFFTTKSESDYQMNFDENGHFTETSELHRGDQYFINEKDFIVMINSKTSDSLYFSYYFKGKKLYLDPVDKNGSFGCDEGCTQIYKRVKK